MYRYDEFDRAFLQDRNREFRAQVTRRLAGELTEDEFKPLRLMNGLYLQLHAYMLRIAVPYGAMTSRQLRQLGYIARRWDKGFGHWTTRQNIQFNWIKLIDVPDILEALAEVDMHAIQTSGNCIRNVTSDPCAGAAADEIEDPRIWAEVLRQWSTNHPEFTYLPRKFKFAVTGALQDRAAIAFHDIGIRIVGGPNATKGFRIFVGGGQGRTPYVAQEMKAFLPQEDLLSYLEAMLRVYNLHGRRDNIYKARIKILVNAIGVGEYRRQVEEEWQRIRAEGADLPAEEIDRIRAHFVAPDLAARPLDAAAFAKARSEDAAFDRWVRRNVVAHKNPDHAIVSIAFKEPGRPPGDATADEMESVADAADRYSRSEVRVTYTQNLVLPHVARADLIDLYEDLKSAGLAGGNTDLITDIIACPGLDYCSLANARSIPIAQAITERFADPERAENIGELRLNISGCINACGHHHAGHIGILGVDKKGTEHYQITLGGSAADDASVGAILGPSFPAEELPAAIENIVDTYLDRRTGGESFLETYARVGANPFKEALYGTR
ncbi:MAG: sulfite reductase [Alphaproteobacteria bacterium BRH_c36]|nr:MAG: sulfite reductase [Alphaproteobacteria bacterium BRH_c36]